MRGWLEKSQRGPAEAMRQRLGDLDPAKKNEVAWDKPLLLSVSLSSVVWGPAKHSSGSPHCSTSLCFLESEVREVERRRSSHPVPASRLGRQTRNTQLALWRDTKQLGETGGPGATPLWRPLTLTCEGHAPSPNAPHTHQLLAPCLLSHSHLLQSPLPESEFSPTLLLGSCFPVPAAPSRPSGSL